jgi:predicted DNA-binding transcriptional regulator AlpA
MTTQSEYGGPTGSNNSPDRFLRQQKVLQRVGTSPVNLRHWEKIGIFPKRYKIGPNSVAWKES